MKHQETELLKIGDFARVAGTNLRTLRYYEERGLLRPANRSNGGFRYYRPADVHRVRLIRDLQDLGLHLDRIRELLAPRPEGGDREELVCQVRQALLEHERLLRERMETLRQQSDKVKEALGKLDACRTCEHRPAPENNFCEPCAHTGQSLPDLLNALF